MRRAADALEWPRVINLDSHFPCPGSPEITGELLHVFTSVSLVHDLQPEQCFDDVLHCHESAHATIFVEDDGDVVTVRDEVLKGVG